MVTQIYTAPIKPYHPKAVSPTPSSDKAPDVLSSEQDAAQGQSAMLAALEEQAQKGVISIQAVVQDFQSTMDALGVPDDVRHSVAPYLQVVAHQSQRTQPSAGLIKNNLKAAGDTLDHYITEALGQPSKVVREWVDALLLQPIDFHSDTPVQVVLPASNGVTNMNVSAPLQQTAPFSSTVNKTDQEFIKQTLQAAKEAAKANDPTKALALYQSILDRLPGDLAPEVQGRVLYRMGRLTEKNKDLTTAKSYYFQAHSHFQNTQTPRMQAKVEKALGYLLQRQGDVEGALTHFQEALKLDTLQADEAAQSLTLNHMGMLYLRNNHLSEARAHLESALEKARQAQPELVGDILSNLGALARREGNRVEAFSFYKESLGLSQSQQNRQAMRQTLQNIASLYLDAGKPEKALKTLESALYRV